MIERAASALAPISPRARDAIRAVSLARDGSLRLGSREGTILYGDDANADAKARTLAALLRWFESEDEEVVSADLRVAGAPDGSASDCRRRLVPVARVAASKPARRKLSAVRATDARASSGEA